MTEDEWCLHDAWECKIGATSNWHNCADGCGLAWISGNQSADATCETCHPQPDGAVYLTKDSGKREEYASGMVRDTQEGKARFDLLLPLGVPYEGQFFTRVAALLARGAEKYSDRNWENAAGAAELARFKASAQRHLMQWLTDETDEDHAAAVVFNLLAYETTKWKLANE
jgi:hypothetical protein